MLLLNLIFALVWMVIQQSFTGVDFVVGFVFGFVIITLTQHTLGSDEYGTRTWRWVTFIAFALWSIIKSNIEVARIVLSPRLKIRPGIVAIPIDLQSDLGITVLANLITLTPGTVTLDVASDRKTLYIHTLNVESASDLREATKQDFERRVKELLP